MNRIAFYIILGVIALAGLIYLVMDRSGFHGPEPDEESYNIVRKWNLPIILEEVSGISWFEENRIACVQDEEGIIFIYNLENSEIERQIQFAGLGDYEGIAIHGSVAYILRSDGQVFEVENFLDEENLQVTPYKTPLTAKQNVEGICVDKKNHRLLLAIKSSEPDTDKYKRIYAFDLTTKKLEQDPVFKVNLQDSIFKDLNENQLLRVMSPSEITIHPQTGEIYFLDGRRPKILIANTKGELKSLYNLNKNEFYQPEGLTFSPSGTMYISNEGKQYPANIIEVEIKPNKIK